jgi:hypothetical protein
LDAAEKQLPRAKWPPLIEISLATVAELEELRRLCPLAESGVEKARAAVRVIVDRVNSRVGVAGSESRKGAVK